jgi:hypothetical protein
VLQKVVTENKLSDRPGNSFNIDESGVQVNKKLDSLVIRKVKM